VCGLERSSPRILQQSSSFGVSRFEIQQSGNRFVLREAKTEFVADGPLSRFDGPAVDQEIRARVGLVNQIISETGLSHFLIFDIHNNVISSSKYHLKRS
jgi:hypothetical protein